MVPSRVSSAAFGLGFDAAIEEEESSSQQDTAAEGSESAPDDAYKLSRRERRRGMDFQSNSELSEAFSLVEICLEPDVQDSESHRLSQTALYESVDQGDNHADLDSAQEDYTWEAEECDSEDEAVDGDNSIAATQPPPSRPSSLRIITAITNERSLRQAHPSEESVVSRAPALESTDSMALEEPFDLDSTESSERSAFDWDSDDDEPDSRRPSVQIGSFLGIIGVLARVSNIPEGEADYVCTVSRQKRSSHEARQYHAIEPYTLVAV
ncbi:hypothetical protein EW026_g1797 [Hermanssonia centrifuga]|uniref:Uncharacterized protein n=1 Tax=Hermanssonia centrifuga TaxID=98765 RepID=A0A4S4KQA7_9APHY|nr:hypothetical protein EW026_g1797 [Hermanssonia centrifuga]